MKEKTLKIYVSIILFFLVIWASSSLVSNMKIIDRDEDGLKDELEYSLGSNPLNIDTDNDGLEDYKEYNYWINRSKDAFDEEFYDYWKQYWNETFNLKISENDLKKMLKPDGDIDGDNKSNICDDDSDNDKLLDGFELKNDTDPALPDLNPPSSNDGGGGENSNSDDSEGGGGGDRNDTITEITKISSSQIYKTGFFYVQGYVTDNLNKPVENMTIEVFVNKTKDTPGSFAGTGSIDSNGFFNISCEVPKDVDVGSNQVVAHTLSNDEYGDSWSDPTINIYSNTTLTLDTASSAGKDFVFPIKGSLLDVDDQPLENKTVRIKWDNEFLTLDKTNNEGNFIFNTSNKTLGNHRIDVEFDGSEFLGSSNDSQKIIIKDMDTYLFAITPTDNFRRGEEVTVQGQLFTGLEEPLPNSEIKIFFENNLVSSLQTSSQGSFTSNIKIPDNSKVGEIPIKIKFPGTDYYAEAEIEDTIGVESDTNINFISPIEKNFIQNDSLVIIGNITDDKKNPVENVSIEISFINLSEKIDSDNNGSFQTIIKIPSNISNASYNIKADFYATNYYLSSKNSISIIVGVVETNPDTSDNNLLIILSIVILGLISGGIVFKVFKNKKGETTVIDPRSIEDIASSTINKLKNEPDCRKTVLECYLNLCKWLDATGLKKNKHDTPREFAVDLKKSLDVSDDCLSSLTTVFEKACYSDHEIIDDDKKTAINCLTEVINTIAHDNPKNVKG